MPVASELLTVSLNELPSWSVWPARILGIEPWPVPRRNLEKIKTEYNDDKYRKLLDWVETQGEIRFADAERALIEMVRLSSDQQVCISEREQLFRITVREGYEKQWEALRAHLDGRIDGCRSLIELGCGAGFNLWYLKDVFGDLELGGGDYSANAVAIARRLGQNVTEFNFYDPSTYKFLEQFPPPIAILTSHALEQLPSAAPFVKNLAQFRDRIKTVIQLEPVSELHSKKLLGMLRSRYAEINDYNRDLLSVLKSSPVEIDRTEYDVIGFNPLNPTSVLQWHFSRDS